MFADGICFGLGSDGGDNARIEEPRQVNAGQPYAAGGAGDEDCFARLYLGAANERV